MARSRRRPVLPARLAMLGLAIVLAGCGGESAMAARTAGPSSSATGNPRGSSLPTASAQLLPTSAASPALSSAVPSVSASALPSPSPRAVACTAMHGTLLDRAYASKIAGGTVHYRVYLPRCYATSGRRYPYVILLHGSENDQTEWTDLLHVDDVLDAGITSGTLAPMILVMPGGGDLANAYPSTPGTSYEAVILTEIIPRVEKEFATFGTREGREIGGVSRGGFWAFSIAFRHPDLFAAVGGHSPYFWPTNAPPSSNPLDLANTVRFSAGQAPRIWVDAGTQDYALPTITPFVETLEQRGIAHQFVLYPTGQHAVSYWRSHVRTYLQFYGKTWRLDADDLPTRSP